MPQKPSGPHLDSKIVQPGGSLSITCRVSGYSLTDSSYATSWIRQRDGKTLDWILTMWYDGSLSQNNALKNKFSSNRDTSAGTITITGQTLQPEDTAVYYCVRMHTVRQNTNMPAQILSTVCLILNMYRVQALALENLLQ
uniref:Ig-like domain-containing protein n=1 Tax=Poecilia reticulata TaxID=8081 RepID=A0A3P9MWZ2_POERE